MRLIILLIVIAFTNTGMRSSTGKKSITVTITNIRSSKGRIQLQIFNDAKSYNDEKPLKTIVLSKEKMKNHTVTKNIGQFDVGIYGIGVLDDENKNGVMDDKYFIPTEGFAFSDYYHTAWSTPSFDKFQFTLKEDKKVMCKMRYL